MRFVVLHHTGWPGREDHYDLMLQWADGGDDEAAVLKTFATLSDAFPDGQTNLLRPLADHRRAYLTFEGPLAHGRGSVRRVEAGGLAWLSGPQGSVRRWRFRLDGQRLKGAYRLRPMETERYLFEQIKGA